jgi:catechol 2,3-dioxygenase-like lactoylglutathione lyase family enzyme
MTTSKPIDPGVRIGHVHLKVAELERALAFYVGVLGFELTQRYGTQAACQLPRRLHRGVSCSQGCTRLVSAGGLPR